QSFIRDDEGLLFGMESAGKTRETSGSIFLQDELGTTVRSMDPAGGVKRRTGNEYEHTENYRNKHNNDYI
ncbi:MAG: hypothetical protein VB031_09355, partial [Eubacteriaceae bacterium]|nr:hypothetical protein [Eubacteriaceae bacterium]